MLQAAPPRRDMSYFMYNALAAIISAIMLPGRIYAGYIKEYPGAQKGTHILKP